MIRIFLTPRAKISNPVFGTVVTVHQSNDNRKDVMARKIYLFRDPPLSRFLGRPPRPSFSGLGPDPEALVRGGWGGLAGRVFW